MYLIKDENMYFIGVGTTVLYTMSMGLLFLAITYQNFFISGIILGALFFVIPSIILGLMVKQRINT